jgi:F0F1-type ATP synthase membrane subunit b/b'
MRREGAGVGVSRRGRNRRRRPAVPGIGAAGLSLIACGAVGVAHAAGAGGEHAQPSLSDLFFPVINFLLFLWLVRRAGGGAIRAYLHARQQQIRADLEAAQGAVGEARQIYEGIQARFARAAQDAEGIRADMRAMATVEGERRRALVNETVARIRADANAIAEQEVRAARMMLRREAVQAAVAETLAVLRRRITPTDQDRFVADFVTGIRTQVSA